jgi:hypothetical protein
LPTRMPAFGFSAVPSPIQTRTNSANGSTVAAAPGETNGFNGSPAEVVAAAGAAPPGLFRSRRVNANAVHINGSAAGPSPPLPPCNHASKPPLNPLTAPPLADNARGAAFVITGTCDSPTGPTTAATTGDAAAGAGTKSSNTKSGCTTNDSGSNCALDTPIEEGATGTGPDDSAPAADGDTTELGTDTEAPVFTGISESPRRRLGSPSREDPPPRTTGADSTGPDPTGADSTGGSLTAAPPLPGTSLPTGSAESPSRRSSPTAAGSDSVADGSLTAGSTASRSPADSLSASDPGAAGVIGGIAVGVDRRSAVGARLPTPSFAFRRSPADRDVAADDRGVDFAVALGPALPGLRVEEAAAFEPGSPACAPRDVDGVRTELASPVSAYALVANPTAVADPMPNATANAPIRPTRARRSKLPLAPMLMAFFDMAGSPGRGSETALGSSSFFVPRGNDPRWHRAHHQPLRTTPDWWV